MSTPRWYQKAVLEIGTKEIAGPQDNPRVVQYQKATGLAASDDETPWCGAFIAWVMKQSGIPYNSAQAARAKSWATWGQELKEPVVGCVVVLNRGRNPAQGHVTLFAGWGDDTHQTFHGLGGNQSNQVSISTFDDRKVVAYRWPPGEALPVSQQKLSQSGVIHGAIVSAAASAIAVAQSAPAVEAGLEHAQTRFNEGTILGFIAGFVALLATGYIIYSRVKGAKADKSIET